MNVSNLSDRKIDLPAVASPSGIDVRPKLGGFALLDLIVTGSAILISCASLFVATQQSQTMERTLAASSWPLLEFRSGNTADTRKLSIVLSVENQGVGPAIVKSFSIVYAGKRYSTPYALLRDCCGYSPSKTSQGTLKAGEPLSQPIEGRVIRGGESLDFFVMDLAKNNNSEWQKLDLARFKLRFEACYCSVLGECWHSDLVSLEQIRVERCAPPQPDAER